MVSYCTWDDNNRQVPNGNTIVLSKGNLQVVQGSNVNQSIKSTFPFHGKQYIEVKMISNSSSVGSRQQIGIIEYNANLESGSTPSSNSTFSGIVFPRLTPYSDGSAGSIGADLTNGQTVCLAFSEDDQKWWYRVNDGSWIGGGDPTVSGSTPSGTFTSGKTYLWINAPAETTDENITDFGSNSYAYTPPSGYLPVNTAKLPAPTIPDPSLHFSGIGYTGNGTSQRIGNFIPFTDSNTVSNSGRLDTGSSQYLTKTFAEAGNNKIGSISFWIKRGKLGTDQQLFHCNAGGSSQIRFTTSNVLQFLLEDSSGSALGYRYSTRTFEMTDTWYHMLFTFDCAAGTMQIYVDGLELTALTSSGPSDTASTFSAAAAHYIGSTHAPADYLDGYLAEFVYVDGTKLTPSSFGQTDTATNRWIPKAITGLTFGTNGFYLEFEKAKLLGADSNASGTAASVTFTGTDSSTSDASSYTFSSQPFSTADSTRQIVVATEGPHNGGSSVSSMTIGGVSASLIKRAGSVTNYPVELWAADVPTGTSGDIVVTWSVTASRCTIGIWAIYNAGGPVDTIAANGSAPSGTIQVPEDGIVIGTAADGFTGGAGTSTWTWTNLTENFDINVETAHTHTGASTTSGTAQAIIVTATPSHPDEPVMAVASWGRTNDNSFAMKNMDTTNGSNQMYDTPTQNFPTYSRNSVFSDSSLTEGNTTIKLVTTNADNCSILQAAIPSSGVYYWEVLALNTGSMYFGVSYNDNTLSTSAFNQSWLIGMNGSRYDPSTGSGTALFASLSAGDMIGMAYNGNLGALYYSINGAWMDGNGSLSNSATVKAEIEAGTATTNAIFINVFQPTLVGTNNITATSVLMPAVLDDSNNTMPTLGSTTNTGSWMYLDSGALTFNVTAGGFFQSTTIPSNAVSLSQDNLLASEAGITAFNLIKSTSAVTNNLISDRLTGPNQIMTTKGPTATQQDPNTGVVNSFLQDGVQIGEYADINTDNALYNSFNWAGGGAGATSSPAGTIPSTVTVNTTAGFSVITYTGSGVAGTIGHGLGVAPACIWVSMRSSAYGWAIYHQELGNTSFIRPFKPDAAVTGSTFWNSTTPIPNTFSVGTDVTVNENNSTFVAFAFTEIAGYSKFGTYIGNGNAVGPYIYCGFRPELVIYKNSSAASTDWVQSSTVDYPAGNPVTNAVFPNLDVAASSREMSIYSNGFKITNSNSDANGDGNTIIFMAWAKYPFGGSGVTQGTAR
tara:strand:+ start:16944 stop:20639 length:3696 start_codon:yes stop_codon:yes gene_type:complete